MNLQEIFADRSIPIHERYSMLAEQLVNEHPVLKTDLWNELNTSWPIMADFYLEIDSKMVDDALEKGINAISGSITNIPFENESISTIIDLSTIDHIADPINALHEYSRVLKNTKESDCFIVSWLGDCEPEKMDNWSGMQYYFDEKEFIIKIYKAGFIIESDYVFEGWGDNLTYLKLFHLKKASGYFINRKIRVLSYSTGIIAHKLINYLNPFNKLKIKHHIKVKYSTILSGSWNGVDEKEITSGENGLCFEALNNDPHVILPKIDLPSDYIYIKVVITPPERTYFQVFYNTKESDVYNEDMSVNMVVGPGRSEIGFEIPTDELSGCLRIDFGTGPGKYCFHNMDIFTIIK